MKLRGNLARAKRTSSSSRVAELTPKMTSSEIPLPMEVSLKMKSVEHDFNAQRYRVLRDYLLRNGFIHHVTLSLEESEPFVIGDIFYGQTFEEALATLHPYLWETMFSPVCSHPSHSKGKLRLSQHLIGVGRFPKQQLD